MFDRWLYALLWTLLLPVALIRLAWKAVRDPAYAAHWPQRLALKLPECSARAIWIHAVSVGETRAAYPLIQALREHYPHRPILLTSMTPTGRDTAQQLLGMDQNVVIAYAPYDHPWLAQRFIRQTTPCLAILIDTEIWPALIHACHQANIPATLVNARLSARSARRYQHWRRFSRAVMQDIRLVACQSTADQQRLQSIGAQDTCVTGNLKFDNNPPQALCVLGQHFRHLIGARRTYLLASSRDGEEAALIAALQQHPPAAGALWIIVPRHPQRFDSVAAHISAAGFTLQRRSDNTPIRTETQIWLGDSMAEMYAYYTAADIALIGGSWLPFGGQNSLEASAVGTPVIFGPHTFNCDEIATQTIAASAGLRCTDLTAAIHAASEWCDNPQHYTNSKIAATQFAQTHRGTVAKTLAVLKPLLPKA